MIKRMSKVTSVLVAAAAIISMAPANAADYKKIDSQEGTVYNAVAYKDGKFFVDAEINDKDDATYYLADGKYNNLADIDTGSTASAYGSKYLNVGNGDYFVDLSNGKVTDEDVESNAQDDTSSALRKNIKKDTDGRYNVTDAATMKNLDGTDGQALPGNKFTDLWYGTTYASLNATNDSAAKLNVYTDANGNYIDADYNLGSIKVTTTASGAADKTVTVSNTHDKYNGAGTSTNGVVAAVGNTNVIGQDANYIYRTAKVTIKTNEGISVSKINGLALSGTTTAFNTATAGEVSFTVIQKISKAQASDDIDGAKYAKSVSTYVVSDDAGVDASASLLGKYTVANGKVVAYSEDSDSVQTQTMTLGSTHGYNYVDAADKSDETAETNTNGDLAVDTDVNGNIYRLSGGYIYKWDNDEAWDKLYKVDGALNEMSVYDADNIVAWNEKDAVYSVIGAKDTTPDTPVENPTNKGWVKTDAGWTYYKADGTQTKGQWVNDGGVWYMIKADGIMATGWYNDNGTWYFLQGSGAMKTGWLNDNGSWYYLQPSGAMKTGWFLDTDGNWYFLNASGAMAANTVVDGYKLGASGAWIR
ncbi:N-acetylmuramoyl-L-alanine amidase family protein [Clostridium saccharoperbutylacetonicum]|uniref:N-acetylmuramoyl-L-alanine amidase family protein n=1 Tax=Clostridium saccharoperbutylacetonicum TaxID=36745 RepID=UPI0039EA2A70